MAFHFGDTQLRVTRKYAKEGRNALLLAQSRLILIEHVLPSTEEFVRHLVAGGATIHALFAKPYSIDELAFERMTKAGVPLHRYSYAELEDYSQKLLDAAILGALDASLKDGKKVVLIDVGGYFSAPLIRLKDLLAASPKLAGNLCGVVEDTTFGHNRYLESVEQLPVPVFSVARSPLKEVEARFVGRDAVIAADYVLRNSGVLLATRHALVIGYGMIGSAVARALRANDLVVSVYDDKDHKNLQAHIDGFHIYPKRQLIKEADIIFAATASNALSFKEIEECKSGAVFASVGSRDTEFDVRSVKEQAASSRPLGPDLTEYLLPNSRTVRIMRDGTAVNFLLPSLPVEVLDLVFSEIFICTMLLLRQAGHYGLGQVHTATHSHLDAISLDWLRFVNN